MLTLVRRLRLITWRATPFVGALLFRCSCFCVSSPDDVERAFAGRDDLKASVATTFVILLGEASGLLLSKGLGLIETRLKVCADGGMALDAADAFPFSDAVNLVGYGLSSPPIGR